MSQELSHAKCSDRAGFILLFEFRGEHTTALYKKARRGGFVEEGALDIINQYLLLFFRIFEYLLSHYVETNTLLFVFRASQEESFQAHTLLNSCGQYTHRQ